MVTPGAVAITQGITIGLPPRSVSVNGVVPAGIFKPVRRMFVGPKVPNVDPGQAKNTVRLVSLHAVASALPMRTVNGTVHPLEVTKTAVAGPADILHPVHPGGSAARVEKVERKHWANSAELRISDLFVMFVCIL